MIRLHSKGDWSKTEKALKKMSEDNTLMTSLQRLGQIGVDALVQSTPKRTGKTAASWSYEVKKTGNGYAIYWKNSNINDGANIAIILQYGHGTGWGGYVEGIDYINPSMKPVFDSISEQAWKEVTKS